MWAVLSALGWTEYIVLICIALVLAALLIYRVLDFSTWCVVTCVTLSCIVCYGMYVTIDRQRVTIQKWEKSAADQKADAERMIEARKKENQIAVQGYIDYAKNIDEASAKKDALIAAMRKSSGGVLYDRGSGQGCGAGRQTGPSHPGDLEEAAAGSGVPKGADNANGFALSVETSEFLKDMAADADRVRNYAFTCYTFVNGLKP